MIRLPCRARGSSPVLTMIHVGLMTTVQAHMAKPHYDEDVKCTALTAKMRARSTHTHRQYIRGVQRQSPGPATLVWIAVARVSTARVTSPTMRAAMGQQIAHHQKRQGWAMNRRMARRGSAKIGLFSIRPNSS